MAHRTLTVMARAVLLAGAALASFAAGAEPDEELLGKSRGYPVGSRLDWYQNPYRVGSWSAMDKVPGQRVKTVAAPASAAPLERMAQPPAIGYRYRNIGYTLDDYLERQRATSLLILKDGKIVAERYRYGRTEDARFLSFSMAKSVTSLLVGIAHGKGDIASLDDPAEKYAKSLAGTPYGATTVRQLLRMSSGLTFTERYDGNDDIARLSRAAAGNSPGAVDEVLRSVTDRHAAAGTKFTYASAETTVLGRVLTGATGRSMAELTSEWLWKPIGAEREAFWGAEPNGQELAHAQFNATLRDWGRLGLLLARGGRAGETQVIPADYLLDATDPARQPTAFKPGIATRYMGYGYQFWLLPMRERTFVMQGVHGQTLYVQPSSGIVMVMTSAWQAASGRQDPQPGEERDALFRGVLRALGGSTD